MTAERAPRRRSLFAKYFLSLVGVVSLVLVVNGGLDMWFAYGSSRDALSRLQQEKAAAAAASVGQFVTEIERQIGWTTHPQWAAGPVEQRRFDFIRLQRQVPAITELTQIDGQGREQLKVSRLSMDVVGSNADLSADPRFREIQGKRVWYSPVYLRKESEPYMSISLARTGRQSGATAAEVNLKLIWDVVASIKAGEKGYAYVVDRDGRLIAHPDISLVLRNTSMARLDHVRQALDAARDGGASAVGAAGFGSALDGTPVLSAVAPVPALGWLVFVEQPTSEALRPLYVSLTQTAALLVLGLVIAALGAWFLSRRMTAPISVLSEGAASLGAGDLTHRIRVRTGDEIESLAASFNTMAERLQESYADLEQKVERRTAELRESLEQQTATAEILQVISQSPTDVKPVLDVVVRAAVRLCGARDALIAMRDGDEAVFAAHEGDIGGRTGERWPLVRQNVMGCAIIESRTVHVPDVSALAPHEFERTQHGSSLYGFKSIVGAPLLREGVAVGALLLRKPEPGPFTTRQIQLLETFAAQAVIAIENVRLFTELRESLEQQTATTEILRVISQSPTDVKPVLDVVADAARRFCGADDAVIVLREGDKVTIGAHKGPIAPYQATQGPLVRSSAMGRAIIDADTVHIPDFDAADPTEWSEGRRLARELGHHAVVAAPMLREGEAIGAVLLRKVEKGAYTQRQIELLETFAAQAVIAIENVRLFTELRESLEQQTASAEVLRVISQSPTDVQPVFDAVARSVLRLVNGWSIVIWRQEGGRARVGAIMGGAPDSNDKARAMLDGSAPEDLGFVGEAMRNGVVAQIADVEREEVPEVVRRVAQERGWRANIAVPMLREGAAIGVFSVSRVQPGAFTESEIRLLQSFADQAVIAIENVRLFTEIQEKSRQLEIASQHKSQFLANMSHELRTPLNAIIGYTEMMADGLYGSVSEKAQGVLERVQNNGRHLLGLINDVLDLSKIEAGQLTLTVEPYSVADMVATVVSATESLARAKGIALATAVAPGLPTGVGDVRRLTQVLLNLVGNAIKFTDQGSVEVRAVQVGDRFEFAVVDTGLGIAPADQARVFDEFQQVDNTSTRKKGGTGLGLSISRKIVELHGGRIALESEPGKGSTFTVSVPIAAAPTKEVA